MNHLEVIKLLFEGKFELPCSEILLTRQAGSPIEISGPGYIQVNSDNKFEVTSHISAQDYQKLFMFPALNMALSGTAYSDEHYFHLAARSYFHGTWNGRVLMPRAGGIAGQAGLVSGTLSEIHFEEEEEGETEFDLARVFISSSLNFPALDPTEHRETRGTEVVRARGIYNHTKFDVDSEEFTLSLEDNYTELECRLSPGSLVRNRHLRMQEALGYALCYPIWPTAMILRAGRQRKVILQSPDRLPKNFNDRFPPFHFANSPLEVRKKFFDLISAYYRKINNDDSGSDQLLSRAVFFLMEALEASIDVQILALGVAAEALIRQTFPKAVVVGQTFREQVAKFKGLLQPLPLVEDLKARLSRAADSMLSPSSSDLIHRFVTHHQLNPLIFKAWKESRNPAAHGSFVNLSKIPEFLERRNNVLYLCHAIVLAFIEYNGPHTRYDVPGWRCVDWPLLRQA